MNKSTSTTFYILTNTLQPGGAERQCLYLANALAQHYRVTMIVYYGNQVDSSYLSLATNDKIQLIRLHGNHFSKLLKLFSLFRKNKEAILISYLATTNFINAIIGTMAGIKTKIGGIRSEKIERKKFIVQRFLHNHFLTYTISNNHAACPYLIEHGFDKDKLLVIHNCIGDLPTFNKKSESMPLKILALSRFVWEKDLIIALRSIELLKKQNPVHRFQFILAGYGPEEKNLRSFIDEKQLSDVVKVVINPDVKHELNNADIFLITSKVEGTSNSIMEAMAFGLPIVTTDAGDSKYLVEDGVTGNVCKIGDYETISLCLHSLVNSYEQRIKFGQNGYHKIKDEFSVETMLSNYLDLMEKK